MGSFKRFFLCCAMALVAGVAGCGGGGSAQAPVAYYGNTTQAVITESNSKRFFDLIFGTAGSSEVPIPVGSIIQDGRGSTVKGSLRLGGQLRDRLEAENQGTGPAWTTALLLEETHGCLGGGTVRWTGEIDDTTGLGELTARFDECEIERERFTGEIVFRIRGYHLAVDEFTDLEIDIRRLRIVDESSDVSMSGTIVSQFDVLTNTEIETLNTVALDRDKTRTSTKAPARYSKQTTAITTSVCPTMPPPPCTEQV